MFNLYVLRDKLERKIAKIDGELEDIKAQRSKTLQDIGMVRDYKARQKEEKKNKKKTKN